MIDDVRRTRAILSGLRAIIRPGDHLLEIGTGFGYFAVAAARLGAAHVWAVEPNDAITLGPALAAQHGVADRITFLQQRSERVELPRRADLLLEDLRGATPLLGDRLAVLRDAKARLLAPQARHVFERDHLMVAPCPAPDGTVEASSEVEGIDVRAVRARAGSAWKRVRATALRPLAPACRLCTLDLTALDAAMEDATGIAGDVQALVGSDGPIGGIGLWFEAEVAGGATLSTGPDEPDSVYGAAWFPFATALLARRGDRVQMTLSAVHDGEDFVWSWSAVLTPSDGRPIERRDASDLAGRLLSRQRRLRRAPGAIPRLTAGVAQQAALLALVDGSRDIAAITAALEARWPGPPLAPAPLARWVARELGRLADESPE